MTIIFKKSVSILLIMFLSISFISCSNQNKNYDNNKEVGQSTIVPNNQNTFENNHGTQAQKQIESTDKLTLDNIKAKYTGGENWQIVNVIPYGKQYVLIEYNIYPTDGNCFDWYDLKTGDKDTLPLYGYHAKLYKIVNENDIKFIYDGTNNFNGHKYFPEVLECLRGQEIPNYDGDFYQVKHKYYLQVDQGINMGVKANEKIADIKVSLKGLEVLFEPMKGHEGEFYAGYTTVPPTKTSYNKSKGQFIIEFTDTDIDKLYNKSKINDQNRYISSVDIKQDGSNTILIINLKETAKYYTIDSSHLEPTIDDSPYLDFNFANEYSIE